MWLRASGEQNLSLSMAVDKLASDDGKAGVPANRPPIANVVAAASEIFAKQEQVSSLRGAEASVAVTSASGNAARLLAGRID